MRKIINLPNKIYLQIENYGLHPEEGEAINFRDVDEESIFWSDNPETIPDAVYVLEQQTPDTNVGNIPQSVEDKPDIEKELWEEAKVAAPELLPAYKASWVEGYFTARKQSLQEIEQLKAERDQYLEMWGRVVDLSRLRKKEIKALKAEIEQLRFDKKAAAEDLGKLRDELYEDLGNGYHSVVSLSAYVKRLFVKLDNHLNNLNSPINKNPK